MNWRIIAVLIGLLVIICVALVVGGVPPIEGLKTLVMGAFGTPAGLRETLRQTSPLLLLGVAVFLALKAGLFNIGADGQFLVGAMTGAAVVLKIPGPVGIVLSILAGSIAGGLWAFPAGWIKAYRGGHEVITTIMLNSIAGSLAFFLVRTSMQSPDTQSPTTVRLDKASVLPDLINAAPFRLNLAVVFGVIAVIALAYWLQKTISGYELKATGGNPTAAQTAGVNVKHVVVRAMVVSGMVAGFAGVLQVLAYEKRFYPAFSPGYGFDALGVALLAGGSPWALLGSALLFGAIAQGTTELSLQSVPKGLNGILLAVVIVAAAVVRYRREVNRES